MIALSTNTVMEVFQISDLQILELDSIAKKFKVPFTPVQLCYYRALPVIWEYREGSLGAGEPL